MVLTKEEEARDRAHDEAAQAWAADGWRRRFTSPVRNDDGLWRVWDRLFDRAIGPYRTREDAREAVRIARADPIGGRG